MSLYIIHTVCTASQSLSMACQRRYLEPNHNLRFKVWTRWKEQKTHYDVQKSVRGWERSSILTSAVLCFPCSRVRCIWGFQVTRGVAGGAEVQPENSGSAQLSFVAHPQKHSAQGTLRQLQCILLCLHKLTAPQDVQWRVWSCSTGHSGLDGTILCILGDLKNFLTNYEMISWPEIQPWAHSAGRQTSFPHNLWRWTEKLLFFFKSVGERW